MLDINHISEEYIKCVSDKSRVYMIENYLKTFDMRENRYVPFKLFPRQKDLIQAFRDYRRNITTKPRQAGITTTTAAFIACEICLASSESPITVLIVGRDLATSQNFLEKVEEFLQQFPRWFWGNDYFSIDEKSEKNKKNIFTEQNKQRLELFNGCKVYAKSSGKNAARGVSSVSWLVLDEAAFIEDGMTVYSQAAATTSTGGKIIMISTPGGKDQLYYGTYHNAKMGKNDFHITELRWYQDPRYNQFLKWTKHNDETNEDDIYEEPILNKKGDIEYLPEHWETMVEKGYKPSSPWYEGMKNTLNNDPQKIAQELDVSFIGSSDNVIDPEVIEQQRNQNQRDPDPNLRDVTLDETWIWKAPIPGHQYLMAIDNSKGDSDDATALEIIDITGIDDDGMPCIEQVLEYNGKLLGDAVGDIANNYGRLYNDAFCVVEDIGGYGSATLIRLQNLEYPNLYYDDQDLKTYTVVNKTSSQNSGKSERLPGYKNGTQRFQMLSNFAAMVRNNEFKIRSERVLTELETWVWKNGRQDHMEGFHDDTITCLAMGLFVMRYSMQNTMKIKSKDEAMMRAMIQANSRIVYDEKGRTFNSVSPKYSLPIYVDKQPLHSPSAAYKASMWLLK